MLISPSSLGGTIRLQRRSLPVLVGALLVTGCGGPTSPSTLAPILVCPTPVTHQSLDGNASVVVFEPPQVVAGQPPLRIGCLPPSGTVFPLGASIVTCSVSDSALRTNACTFTITVVKPPHLMATRFMAFGNSITAGEVGNNYPATLRALLAARYTTQASSIQVVNRGRGGEGALGGADRLPDELDAVRPEVLLLEEGINDLTGGLTSRIPTMIAALRDMVREAKSRRPDIVVLLATLPPTREGSPKGASAFPLIPEANARIRSLATSEGVTLVDLYEGFGGHADPYIDVDGLHPNALGYQKMAEIFFDVIRGRLEAPQDPAPSFELVRNLLVAGPH
jgi:lysophospholipase L1-like esterase